MQNAKTDHWEAGGSAKHAAGYRYISKRSLLVVLPVKKRCEAV